MTHTKQIASLSFLLSTALIAGPTKERMAIINSITEHEQTSIQLSSCIHGGICCCIATCCIARHCPLGNPLAGAATGAAICLLTCCGYHCGNQVGHKKTQKKRRRKQKLMQKHFRRSPITG